jgi:hypothetical protein
MNRSAKMGLVVKTKHICATSTRLVSKLCGNYNSAHFPDDTKEVDENDEPKKNEEEQEDMKMMKPGLGLGDKAE